MSAPRNFRLGSTNGVLMPRTFGPGIAMGVIAGEACTELGSELPRKTSRSWLERWLHLPLSKSRSRVERKDHGTHT
jgi:hypothetical protein